MARIHQSRRARRGAQAVEFALTIPIILLMGLGVIDYGFYLHQQIDMVEASAAGARVGGSQYWEAIKNGDTHADAVNAAITAGDAACEEVLDQQGRPAAASCSVRVYDLQDVGDSIEVTTTEAFASIVSDVVPVPATTGYIVTSRL